MPSAICTAAIVPRIVDEETPSLDCCNKYPKRTSPFPFPGLPMASFHNFPKVLPQRLEVQSAAERTTSDSGLSPCSCARAS